MKRILVAIFSVFMAFGAARADCADNEFAYVDSISGDVECVEAEFILETTELTEDATFIFNMSVAGTFYVDWGDGTVEKIERTDTNNASYSHTYVSPGGTRKQIKFNGNATQYNNVAAENVSAISFSTASKTLVYKIYGSLGLVFSSIGDGDLQKKQPKFYGTFSGCSNLSGTIPPNLFDGVHGMPVPNMFAATFSGCSGLTGSIPGNLFSGISGTPKDWSFQATFSGCSGLTGIIPKNLFQGVYGTTARNSFTGLFNGCSGLTGYIPPELFDGIIKGGSAAFTNAFLNATGLYRTCPCGTHQYTMDLGDGVFYGAVSCQVGTKDNEHWNNGVCTTDCALGLTKLKSSTGLEYPILSATTSQHSINVGVGNDVCHVPLANGAANNAINASFGGATYHVTVPDEIVPAGFTGQPE